MSSKIIAGTTSGTALNMSADTSGQLEIQTGSGPTTAITVTSAQLVGIGTTSPQAGFDVNANSQFRGALALTTDNYLYSYNGGTNGQVRSGIQFDGTNQNVVTYTSATERMRVDAAGNLLVGTNAPLNGYSYSGAIHGLSTNANQLNLRNSNATAGRVWTLGMTNASEFIVYANGVVGQYMNWSGTSWISSSDERTKDIIEPITNALDKVSSLRTVIGKYKSDDENVRRSFLIAQDVQKVFPEAVDVRNDEDKTLGLSYTEIVPLLVASIKELNAKVDAQAAEIKALKGVA